jgi:hypothetical protein
MYLRLHIVRFLYKLFNGTLLSFLLRLYSTSKRANCLLRLKKGKTVNHYELINQTVFDPSESKINFESFIIQIKHERWIKEEQLKNHSISLGSYFEGIILYPLIRIYWGYRMLNFKYRKRQSSRIL